MRLAYIANARLPTEKAHGFQIAKMCEAFSQNGADVELFHPFRRQSAELANAGSLFDYYHLKPSFRVQRLPNLDVVALNRILPEALFPALFFTHSVVWSLYAALYARTTQADLYYTRNSSVAFWMLRLGLPTAYEEHGWLRRGQKYLLQHSARAPSLRRVFALTEYIGERLVGFGFPSDRVMAFPNGVDIGPFEGLPDRRACRIKLGLPTDRPIVGYLGRFLTLSMEKGIPELIQSVSLLRKRCQMDPLLLCVGGPMSVVEGYQQLARRCGVPERSVQFVDRVPNEAVPLWIRAFDIAAMPFPTNDHYRYCMSPIKMFEYMASQSAIVATDHPSVRNVLRHGENAWLVRPDDPSALADGLEAVLSNSELAARLADRAYHDVNQYTWSNRAAQILQAAVGG